MAKLSRSALSDLSKQDLVDLADQLQREGGAGWHGGHFLAILAAFLLGIVFNGAILGGELSWRGFGRTQESGRPSPKGAAQPPSAGEQPAAKVDVQVGSLPVLGQENAPVTIVEFTDYQCPFCGRHFTSTMPQIKKEYIDPGKVKYYVRDFPLTSIHPQAQKAAEAARCADDQNAFWKYHDTIFENQQTLSEANLKKWAVDLGLDAAAFNDCLDSGKHEQAVKDDLAAGTKLGVNGTPGFFINGRPVKGAQPFESFQKIVDQALAESD